MNGSKSMDSLCIEVIASMAFAFCRPPEGFQQRASTLKNLFVFKVPLDSNLALLLKTITSSPPETINIYLSHVMYLSFSEHTQNNRYSPYVSLKECDLLRI